MTFAETFTLSFWILLGLALLVSSMGFYKYLYFISLGYGFSVAVMGAAMALYENPIEHACDMRLGQVFIANGWQRPEGMCQSAWESMSPFVMTLAYGGEDIYDGWMKNKKSAMISCNDGFRPVSFYIEALEEDAE